MERIDLQMGMYKKAWENPYNFAHEHSRWMNYQSSKAILLCGFKKYALDVIDENILKCS